MVNMVGTEHRDRFRTFTDATGAAATGLAKPAFSGELTSSLRAFPWPDQHKAYGEVKWLGKAWMPAKTPDGNYVPTSAQLGAVKQSDYHKQSDFDRAKVAATMRYLQVPYLSGSLAEGAGIDGRPTSAVGTFSLGSEEQALALTHGALQMHSRQGNNAAWTGSRSIYSRPVTAVSDAYMTTTNASFKSGPVPDSQQHRLRKYTTSSLLASRSLDSSPMPLPTAALHNGGATLHETRFLGVRDSDGGRRVLEIDTTGVPAPVAGPKIVSAADAGRATMIVDAMARPKFVSSQPKSTSTADLEYAIYASIDPSSTKLPRVPWPYK